LGGTYVNGHSGYFFIGGTTIEFGQDFNLNDPAWEISIIAISAPLANNIEVSINEDATVAITLTGCDADGDEITFTVVDEPTNGTLSGTVPVLTYTPNAGWFGVDTFTYQANDGALDSEIATVTIKVNESIVPDGSGIESDPYQIANLANLRWLSETSSVWDKYFIQTADIDATETSSWNDGAGFSPIGNSTTSFQGDYDGQNHTISNLYISRESNNVGLFGKLSGTIANLGLVDVNIYNGSGNFIGALIGFGGTAINCYSSGSVSGAMHVGGLIGGWGNAVSCYSSANVYGYYYIGGLMGTGGSATNSYAMGSTINGHDNTGGLMGYLEIGNVTNCYSASSSQTSGGLMGGFNTEMSSVTNSFWDITVSGQSSSAGGTGKTTAEMKDYVTFTAADWDFEIETVNGTNNYWDIDNANGIFNSGYPFLSWQNGDEVLFDYNDAPVADDIAVTTDEDVAVAITLTGSDADGDELTFSIVDEPTNGTLSGTVTELTYTPNTNWFGSDIFTYKANDGELDSELATVTITVNSTNTAPIAEDISVETDENIAIEIILVGNDADGDELTYAIETQPINGVAINEGGVVQYTPNAGWFGVDTFTYKANDGELDSDIATVSITVNEVLAPPPAPTNVQIVVTVDDINHMVRTISWNPAVGVDYYNVYVCDTPYGEFVQLNEEPITDTTFESVGGSVMKFFRVTANNGGVVTISPKKSNFRD